MTETPPAVDDLELLAFELAGVRYALPLSVLREVVRAVWITPLPDAPPVVEGAINVRGVLVPVYDLRARFRLPVRPLHPDDRIVLAWTGTRLVALRAERVEWIGRVPATAVATAGDVRSTGRHVAGVVRLEDGLVLIQDLAAFLDDGERALLDTALATAAGPAAV